jgi:RNA polymerase sigma-32 factor
MDAPFLEREEERLLAVRWKDNKDEAALHRLTSAHMRLVIALAARFRHYGLPMADLVQEGHVGLLEAAARFEPEREVRFSTYATWWIRASIQDYILRNWSIVRGGTSSAQKALFFNLRRLRAKLTRAARSGSRARCMPPSPRPSESPPPTSLSWTQGCPLPTRR